MIRGDFCFPPNALPNLPVWCADPLIEATIKIPMLAIEKPFTLMVDTGAGITALHVRDVPRLGERGYRLIRQLGNSSNPSGVGGSAIYFGVPAQIIFEHEDGTLEQHDFNLWVSKRARKGSRKLANQLKIPSVLGRDVLCHFRMVMNYHRNQLFLYHI